VGLASAGARNRVSMLLSAVGTVGWPIALIAFGMFMIGLSALAFRIDRDYVRSRAAS
jgi:hypothetical protein